MQFQLVNLTTGLKEGTNVENTVAMGDGEGEGDGDIGGDGDEVAEVLYDDMGRIVKTGRYVQSVIGFHTPFYLL